MRYYFFLSYARGDDDEYVQRFYRDLCREVRVRGGLSSGTEVGFVDVENVPLGANWLEELVAALSTCAVFLPLYSPGYFASEPCGKEWAAFTNRMTRHRRDTGSVAKNLIPILWYKPIAIPEVAQPIQYNWMALGPVYAEYGLRQLVRLQRFTDDYMELVTKLANEIVTMADSHSLVEGDPATSFDGLVSPFRMARAPIASHPALPAAAGTGTLDADPAVIVEGDDPVATANSTRRAGHVHFVVAATSREKMGRVRSGLQYYGASPTEWAPYRPDLPDALGAYAGVIAGKRHLGWELGDLGDLPQRMDASRVKNQIVVLLVDPWIARVAGYGESLLEFDRRNEPTSPVLIPFSDADEETVHHREALRDDVERIFPNNEMRQDSIYRPDVQNAQDFATQLHQALEKALNRLLRRGHVYRTPPVVASMSRPVLEGPDSISNRRP